MVLSLYNTLSRSKEIFTPLDESHIQIYACGPTVYDLIHVGNARPLVVFDVLVRLLRYHYPQVTYVRNITDVDDKINQRATERGISIETLCDETIEQFHHDTDALMVVAPDIEPRATHHIDEMVAMIKTLIAGGFAYEADGHVLFSVAAMPAYGGLSARSMDEMIAGARVEVAPYKRDAADFVLWKPSGEVQPGWDSPWGYGRPGWHIECSAMSARYLGEVFDIHAGGLDLIFPHHENEIAQSCCAHGTDAMARYWVHNGYVTVEGEKMSKSLGNFTTVQDALRTHRGEVVRYALLAAHYRAPLDFSLAQGEQAQRNLDKLYRIIADVHDTHIAPDDEFLAALGDDMNTPLALARLHKLAAAAQQGDTQAAALLKSSAALLGLLQDENWFGASQDESDEISQLVKEREQARATKDFARADEIRDLLEARNIRLLDGPDGTRWEKG